jgi:hypothetical protein
MSNDNTQGGVEYEMIHNTCPCCEVARPPHRDGCTFAADCPEAWEHEMEHFLEKEFKRIRIKNIV